MDNVRYDAPPKDGTRIYCCYRGRYVAFDAAAHKGKGAWFDDRNQAAPEPKAWKYQL